ncbi:hypothetical protein [Flexibacterium corallicola]|uniref:hypothetical protein n=1 Tax=Flexibacterium corallicola TaxID=3037259 RepID=UPI00286EDF0A|nr:hypothetical protein [Pseudovibrio sp. M1P-2-3]
MVKGINEITAIAGSIFEQAGTFWVAIGGFSILILWWRFDRIITAISKCVTAYRVTTMKIKESDHKLKNTPTEEEGEQKPEYPMEDVQ